MWMITDKGFISAVEYRVQKDKTDQLPPVLRPWTQEQTAKATRKERKAHEDLVKDGFILARARIHDDLEQLRPYFPQMEIQALKSADYKFRAVLPRQAFTDAVADAAWDIDYASHFKEIAEKRSPSSDETGCDPGLRHSAMMSCWTALNRMVSGAKYAPVYKNTWSGSGKGISGGASVHGSGMVSPSSAPAYGERKYPWEKKFEDETHSKPVTPFGSGSPKPMTSQEALQLAAEYESLATENMTEVRQALGEQKAQTEKPRTMDTVAEMVEVLLSQEYDDIDCDYLVPNASYELYSRVPEYMTPRMTRADGQAIIEALTDLLEDEAAPKEDKEAFQLSLDEMEGVLSDQAAVLEQSGSKSGCEIVGYHLEMYKHKAEDCRVELAKTAGIVHSTLTDQEKTEFLSELDRNELSK